MKYQIIGILLLAAIVLVVGVYIHSAGAAVAPQQIPETVTTTTIVREDPIVIGDNGVPVRISMNDILTFHAELEAKEEGIPVPEQREVDPCCVWMYRSLSTGIRVIWGDTIPERTDVSVTSNLVSCGALHTGGYVTGTGPGMDITSAGRFILLQPDGTELTDYSHDARSKIAKNRKADNYQLIITRISTGESATISLREEVFPDRFFTLFKKVKTDSTVTKEEIVEFKTVKNEFRDNLVQKTDDELFNIVRAK